MLMNTGVEPFIFRKLKESRFSFYLTGSRYFGGSNSTSDWDYFVTDSSEVREFLYSLGFITREAHEEVVHYSDVTIIAVMGLGDVHIQMVSDAKFKDKVQSYLMKYGDMKNTPKAARTYLWNLTINLLKAEEEQMVAFRNS